MAGYWKLLKNRTSDFIRQITSLTLVLAYFLIVLAYVLLRKPAMYDGMRHFFFILPPIFIFIGFAFEFLIDKLTHLLRSPAWLYAGLGLLLIAPGINGIIRLHPYEYAYYNSFVGGTDGAFRSYETDYWLTCYKEAVNEINSRVTAPTRLFVYREASIAKNYTNDLFDVQDLRKKHDPVQPGDYILINTRSNEDQKIFNDEQSVMEIKRGNATFCIIRQVR
jgi:hypothetical protein